MSLGEFVRPSICPQDSADPVALVRLSTLAEADLLDIGQYTLRTWGAKQTILYLDNLEACFRRIAVQLSAGRPCDDIRPGLHRYEQGKHVVFFRRTEVGILVTRILHQRMSPDRHLFEDKEEDS